MPCVNEERSKCRDGAEKRIGATVWDTATHFGGEIDELKEWLSRI